MRRRNVGVGGVKWASGNAILLMGMRTRTWECREKGGEIRFKGKRGKERWKVTIWIRLMCFWFVCAVVSGLFGVARAMGSGIMGWRLVYTGGLAED